MQVWLANYLAFHKGADRNEQLLWLAVLARGISELIDTRQIKGDWQAERLCRWSLASIRRYADFRQLHDPKREWVRQIRSAQVRLEGIMR